MAAVMAFETGAQFFAPNRVRIALPDDFGAGIQGTASAEFLRDVAVVANPTASPAALFDEADFNRFWNRLRQMRRWQSGWDGYDALPPDQEALRKAEGWSEHFYALLTRDGIRFQTPLVTADANGTVVVEWRNNGKTLSLYFPPSGDVEYLKVWGKDISNNMEDGILNHPSRAVDLLTAWLMA